MKTDLARKWLEGYGIPSDGYIHVHNLLSQIELLDSQVAHLVSIIRNELGNDYLIVGQPNDKGKTILDRINEFFDYCEPRVTTPPP